MYKIYQQLTSGMATLGLVNTTDIDDQALNKKLSYLNNMFNQGKNAQGQEVGKTYSAGDGIDINQQDEVSAKVGTGLQINQTTNNIDLKVADSLQIGGIKSSVSQSYTGGLTNLDVIVNANGTAKVIVPTSTDNQIGLMSAADHQRLKYRMATMDYGTNETTMTYINMEEAANIERIVTRNVATLVVTPQNGTSTTVTLNQNGAANVNINIPADGGVVCDITRVNNGDAIVALKYKIN